MLKKYFYISILLGVFALLGCTDDKVDTTKTEEEAPILLNLTQEQKENYYNQYLEILEDISSKLERNKKPGIIKSALLGLKDFILAAGADVTAALIVAKLQELF